MSIQALRGIESHCDMCYFCSECRTSLVTCAIEFVCTQLVQGSSSDPAEDRSRGHEQTQAGIFLFIPSKCYSNSMPFCIPILVCKD